MGGVDFDCLGDGLVSLEGVRRLWRSYVESSSQSATGGREEGLLEAFDVGQGHGVWDACVLIIWLVTGADNFVWPSSNLEIYDQPGNPQHLLKLLHLQLPALSCQSTA